ncbi:hypothetical protein E2C01_072376 [Portunus trituberculatus]|uniref:Uncharacterized protein n=1 Tax=Portunus trituberculatus TaxID=210409 RepID=A0A5B7I8S9_PORTR|nr:hypothetical protein [Portunus trituberculatus]
MTVRGGEEALRRRQEGQKDAMSRNTQDITHLQPRRNTPPAESTLSAATSLRSEGTRASSPATGRQHQGDNWHAITLGTTRHSCMATLAATAAGVIGLCGTRPLASTRTAQSSSPSSCVLEEAMGAAALRVRRLDDQCQPGANQTRREGREPSQREPRNTSPYRHGVSGPTGG